MLTIPKELKGKKAIPFMEWYICYYNNYGGTMDVITDFYSQPFQPEMLMEYFEGWKKDESLSNTYRYNQYDITIDDDDKSIYYIYDNETYRCWEFKSLNDLITLCTLAGVELTWKGETE